MNKPALATILIADDMPSNINILGNTLQDEYQVKVATTGEAALEKAIRDKPDLILLDIMMPGMDGYEICRCLKETPATSKIPVIFVTSLTDIDAEIKGFAAGAVDYINKPISPPVVRARVKTHLALFDQNKILAEQVKKRTEELSLTQDVTIASLASLAEYRDNETGGHIKRTQNYLRLLAEYLMQRSDIRICRHFDRETIDIMVKSAPLHDIGKVGIPDHILKKPGKLTEQEFEEMKKHTVIGEMAIRQAEQEMGGGIKSSFLRFGREMAATHHEKWDGSGYPRGLAGENIPVVGRLMILADIYDALVSKRVYKQPLSHEEAVDIIQNGDGRAVRPSHFDPEILSAFMAIHESFRDIAKEFAD